jgi:PAS domain S-box-containing protein
MLFLSKSKIAAVWTVIVAAGAVTGWFGYHRAGGRILAGLTDDAQRCAAAFEPANLRLLTGTRADLQSPTYADVKRRLLRLKAVNQQVRFVYLFRFIPETGKVLYLGDSAVPGAKDESLPGDEYPQAAQSPGLQEIIRTGFPATEGPLADDFGKWVTGYALVSEASSTKPEVPIKEIVGMDIDAMNWTRALWLAGFQDAFFVWVLLGLPFFAYRVTLRQTDQREAIRNLSEAMEQSHSAIMIVDLENCVEYANRGLCQQIGYSRRELIGRNWREFQAAETPPEKLAELASTVRSGHSWEGEWFNRRKDGTTYPVRGVVTPVKRRDGAIACFVAVFDDMTEIKRNEHELREARDLAQAGDRAKGQFLATMSHEVRTPLNGIVGFTSLLLETSLTPEQREYVQTIRTGGEALIHLTGDILDFARIESGRLQLESLPCDPADCVEEALDLLAGRAAEKHIELLHWIDDDVPAAVLADGGRLRQMLVNLVGNAVKFTEVGGVSVTVRVRSRETGPDGAAPAGAGQVAPPGSDGGTVTLEFSVADTGIGIAPDQHAKLFKPFTQIDATSTRKYGGTGLGLAISRNLVRLMGGDISFTSESGRGSTFTFFVRLPVLSAPAPAPDLGGLRLALVGPPGPLRSEIARLAARWRVQLSEAESPAALAAMVWTRGWSCSTSRRPGNSPRSRPSRCGRRRARSPSCPFRCRPSCARHCGCISGCSSTGRCGRPRCWACSAAGRRNLRRPHRCRRTLDSTCS